MKDYIEPEEKPKANIQLRTTVDNETGTNFLLLCDARGNSENHMVKQAVKRMIKDYRAEIEEQRRKKTFESDTSVPSIAAKPKRRVKKGSNGQGTESIQVDTPLNHAGGAVLVGPKHGSVS